ncbi:restriction endonuclease subunit S [Aeromicrobium sp. IC_218]|uniref:restriction endonuclease subunit S n=1 Tax=Aeromicrobium sp. IC_218 TaxID=2545468 RepID=UPI00103991B4|nr:restriction endonuclease subunit S [Aeromicrobium sp. IC_218]TCI98635.1 restriction endonuclease subunit S [Aeromicrobium sp. IC_218]
MRTVELGSVATIERKGVDPLAVPPETLYIGLEHIERGGRIIGHDTVAGAELASTKFQFSPDHVLFGKLRPNLGKVCRPNFTGVCSTDILPIRPGKDLDRNYLAYYLGQPSMVEFAASRTSGANLPRLSPTVLATFPVPLPPLPEQHRIAAILDHADALRAKRRQVLAHLDSLSQSIFHDMFGDLHGGRWERVPFGELVPRVDNGTSPNCEARPAASDEWAVLKLGAVTYGYFRPEENKAYLGDLGNMDSNEVRSGDVLMTRKNTRELVGAVALVDEVRPHLLLPDLIFRLHLDGSRLDRRYFQALMMNPQKRPSVRDLSSGSASSMPNISKARLAKLPLELPPLALQREFAARVDLIGGQRARVEAASAVDDMLFASLQSRAFRGDL